MNIEEANYDYNLDYGKYLKFGGTRNAKNPTQIKRRMKPSDNR